MSQKVMKKKKECRRAWELAPKFVSFMIDGVVFLLGESGTAYARFFMIVKERIKCEKK